MKNMRGNRTQVLLAELKRLEAEYDAEGADPAATEEEKLTTATKKQIARSWGRELARNAERLRARHSLTNRR